MPRHRQFNPEKLLQTATHLFWEKGYCDTSVDELVKRSGVAKYGIYSIHATKRGLFKAALAQYAADRHLDIQAPIRKEDASLNEVLDFFNRLPETLTGPGLQHGCLMVNTGIELGMRDTEFSGIVRAFFDDTTEVMKNCLDRAVAEQQLPAITDTERLARYLVNEFRTLLMLAASGDTRRELEQHLDSILTTLT